ncbi:hypothetical protein [Pelagibacterium sediminicola]|uniref:hypothetical protein n=1 Tax=Pelagibacterium sediminicola TaxID=2248761 RepID=UPI0013008FCB|nr:hypothetical protein [Pelagibacterium sediminicola]
MTDTSPRQWNPLTATFSRRRAIWALVSCAALLPIFILSALVANEKTRDNLNYWNFYSDALSHAPFGIIDAVSSYRVQTGASEPLSFLFFYAFAVIGAPFVVAVIVKNVAIFAALNRFRERYLGSGKSAMLFVAYVSTDYYMFRLLSELHRLGVAVAVALVIATLARRQIIGLAVAALAHFQVVLLAPALFLLRPSMIAMLGGALVAPFFLLIVQDKIAYYLTLNWMNGVRFAVIAAPFFALSLLMSRTALVVCIALIATLGPASILLGPERVVILFWEVMVLTLFVQSRKTGRGQFGRLAFFTAVICTLIPYNIYRIWGELGVLATY